MSLCVIFVSIDKLNSQKTPFSSIIQLFKKKKCILLQISYNKKEKGKKEENCN